MTRRKRGLLELSRVPRIHDHPPARGLLANETDRVAQLVDVPAVGCDPVAPLLPVVAAGITRETRTALPVVGERVAVPDMYAERVQVVAIGAPPQEPEQLRADRAEPKPLRRHRGKS